MRRDVEVYLYNDLVGYLKQRDDEFIFEYLPSYHGRPLSLSLPISQRRFVSNCLHPYFCSLAPEGWLKARYSAIQRIDERDLLGLLIRNGKNLIGAVRLQAAKKELP